MFLVLVAYSVELQGLRRIGRALKIGVSVMSVDGEDTRWMCGRSSMVNLQRVSSIMREIRDPCLQHSPAKRHKSLKPEKWQAIFDSEGKVIGFWKALKLIVLGGVDPSIRAEVWEFLLGCYTLNSTSEYRKQLRMARRKRYEDLIKQCQMMHSSVGTGNLAYVVGSKVMDVRTSSKESDNRKSVTTSGEDTHDSASKGVFPEGNNGHSDPLYSYHRKSSSDSAELVSARMSTDSAAYNCHSRNSESEITEGQFDDDSFYDFPPLPVTNLFQKDNMGYSQSKKLTGTSLPGNRERLKNDHMYSFEISNNVDLIMEAEAPSASTDKANIIQSRDQKHVKGSKESVEIKVSNELKIVDAPESGLRNGTANEDRVSEWLWTLHRIVVDVVRTDSHLDFYGDTKNMARMSDILAVYAWVDPATGYCQGMSDLLSPFVVLYEDNADAFWCFEMLLRRMRENFQMEGPTGVMKQLQALWKILELTDTEIFEHLSLIGAESLHFAFRMLLVLFRRELSFDDALRMWEMIWAADFDEPLCQQLENNCLEPLVIHLRKSSGAEMGSGETGKGKRKLKSTPSLHKNGETYENYAPGVRSIRPFCGLAKANFWSKNEQMSSPSSTALTRNMDDELPVFCVAAILISNQQKIIRETQSIDDIIKMFNDNLLKINVKRCIHMAIKLRKKYFYKLTKQLSLECLSNSKFEKECSNSAGCTSVETTAC